MAEKFDPYRTWLGIPPEEQPPNHYRLLGVGLFESLPDVIANAADRQMVHVRTFQSGKHSKLSQKILNELSAARVCLLDPQRKAAYDEELRQNLAEAEGGAAQETAGFGAPDMLGRPAPRRRAVGRGGRKKKGLGGMVVVLIAVGVAVAVIFAVLLTQTGSKDTTPSGGAASSGAKASDDAKRHTDRAEPKAADKSSNAEIAKANPALPPAPTKAGPGGSFFGNMPAKDTAEDSNAASGEPARRVHLGGLKVEPGKIGEIGRLDGHTATVTGVALDRYATRIVSCSLDGTVRQWDVERRRELWTFEGNKEPVLRLVLSAQPPTVVASCGEPSSTAQGTVRTWLLFKRPLDVTLEVPSQVLDLAVSDDTLRAVFACHDGKLRVSRLKNETMREKYQELAGHAGPVRAVAITADHTHLLSGGEDRTVRWWSVDDKREQHKFTGHSGPVSCVALAPDGNSGASAGADGSIRVWDLSGLSERRVLLGPAGAVTALAFLPDGRRILSAGADGVIRLWKLSNGREIYRFTGHQGAVRTLTLDQRGEVAISGGEDHSIRLWALPARDAKLPPLAAETAAVATATARQAVPAADAQAAAEATIKNVRFKGEFSVVELPKKVALAQKLLAEAQKSDADPAAQFVLLRLAKDMAAAGGDVDTLYAVADLLAKRFDVDLHAARVAGLDDSGAAALPQAVRRGVVERALAELPELAATDHYDLAQKLATMLRSSLPKVRDPQLTKQFQATLADIEKIAAEDQALKPLREKLRTQPDDPQANETVGRALCFAKGRWDDGLPLLARAADADLKKLAASDLNGPDEPEAQVAVADSWWERAEKEAGVAQQNLRRRACWWYAMAQADVTGDVKARVKQRLAEAAGKPVSKSDFEVKPAGDAPATKPAANSKTSTETKPPAPGKASTETKAPANGKASTETKPPANGKAPARTPAKAK